MADPRFYDRAGPFALARIAEILGAGLEPAEAAEWTIEDVASLASAQSTDLGFAVGRKVVAEMAATRARAVLIDEPTRGGAGDRPEGRAYLLVKDPQRAFAEMAERFYPPPVAVAGIDTAARVDPTAEVAPTAEIAVGAVVGPGARIGESVAIGPNTVIGRGCVIGRGTRIGSNATLAFALVGENCLFHPGVRIGQDGFGFAMGVTHRKIPQLGRVVVGDDVEVGANTTIDRGALDDTVIGNGVIIDNLVQIGHNCRVGDGSVIVAQSGLAGGTRLEHHVVMAAQSGVVGHLTIGAGARVGGQSGVMRDVPPGTDVFGTPAEPARGYWRRYTRLRRMADKNDE